MKKFNLLLTAVVISQAMTAQDISGQWNGILKVQGIQLRLVFNIAKNDSGYSSTMDSPDQGAKGIPVTLTSFKDSILNIEISSAKILYTGKIETDGNFIGEFKQGGMVIPLSLTKGLIEKEKISRPQEPAKPYPYYSEDITFNNKKDNITLAGTLTLPAKEGNFPAVVLITGSGPQNRDEEIFGHKPFLVISDYLTRNGIAVLRFDDRGVGESKGDFKNSTTLNFVSDVESAVNYLQTRKEINQKKIGLIGHSEGGIIAPIVAAESKGIAFIVLLAGTGISGGDLMLLQKEMIERASGISEPEIQKGQSINKGAFEIIKKSANTENLKGELETYFKTKLKESPESKPSSLSEENFVSLQVNQFSSPWMQFFIAYDPYLILKDVKCPVLALNGAKDLQVPSKVNLDAIKKGLENGGNKAVTVKELPELNHLFQECKTGLPNEYGNSEQTISPKVLKELSDWIQTQLK